jgi:hypothetical protein
MRIAIALGFLCLWPCVGPVHAQKAPTKAVATQKLAPLRGGNSVAVLPMAAGGDAQQTQRHESLVRAVLEQLRARGFRVLAPKEVQAKLSSHTVDSCRNPATCDPALALATLGADAVVSIAFWQRPAGASQLVVHVRRQHGYGQAEVAASDLHDKELRATAASALRSALEDSLHSHEIDVWIESQPTGATARVDQTLSSTTPAHFALLPGSHLVSIEAPGFVTRAQYLELSESSGSETRLRVELESADQANVAAAAAAPSRMGPQPGAAAPAARSGPSTAAGAPAARLTLQPSAADELPPANDLRLTSEPRRDDSGGDPPRDESAHPSSLNYVLGAVLLGIAVPLLANATYSAATRGDCVGHFDATGHCSDRVQLGPAFAVSAGLGLVSALGGIAFLVFAPVAGPNEPPQGARVQYAQHF